MEEASPFLRYAPYCVEFFTASAGEARFSDLRKNVAFVAVKNGEHDGIGYFLDTGKDPATLPEQFPLHELSGAILESFGE